MFKTIATAAAFAGVLLGATAAWAARQDFVVVNNTGQVIVSLNVSASNDIRWGPDILGSGWLANGERAQVGFENSDNTCLWDLRVTYEGGGSDEWRQVNLCETSEITLNGG